MGKHRKAHHHKSPLTDISTKLNSYQWSPHGHGTNRPRAKSHSHQQTSANPNRITTQLPRQSTYHSYSKPKSHRPPSTAPSSSPPWHPFKSSPNTNPACLKTPCALRTDYHHMKHHSTIRAIFAEGSLLESKLRLFLDGLASFLKRDPEVEEMDWEVSGRVEVVVRDRNRDKERVEGKEGKKEGKEGHVLGIGKEGEGEGG